MFSLYTRIRRISFLDPSGAQGVTMSVCESGTSLSNKEPKNTSSFVGEDFNFTALLSVVAVGALCKSSAKLGNVWQHCAGFWLVTGQRSWPLIGWSSHNYHLWLRGPGKMSITQCCHYNLYVRQPRGPALTSHTGISEVEREIIDSWDFYYCQDSQMLQIYLSFVAMFLLE